MMEDLYKKLLEDKVFLESFRIELEKQLYYHYNINPEFYNNFGYIFESRDDVHILVSSPKKILYDKDSGFTFSIKVIESNKYRNYRIFSMFKNGNNICYNDYPFRVIIADFIKIFNRDIKIKQIISENI